MATKNRLWSALPAALATVAMAIAGQSSAVTGSADGGLGPWGEVLQFIDEGRLDEARKALASTLDDTEGLSSRARMRIGSVIEMRRKQARDLVHRAARDLEYRHASWAERRIGLAQSLDEAVRLEPAAQAVRQNKQVVEQALALARACFLKRDSACLRTALTRARSTDLDNAEAMQIELAAQNGYTPAGPASQADATIVDGPTR